MSLLSFPSVSKKGSSRSRRRGRRTGRNGRVFLISLEFGLEDRLMLATDYWTGHSASQGGNDNWNNAGNWSTGNVPGTADTADFTSSESQYSTSVVSAATTVNSVVIDSTWNGTLTVSNSLSITGTSGDFTLASVVR